MYENILYCIVPVVDLEPSLMNVSLETSMDTLRLSNDGDYTVLKFYSNDSLAKEILVDYEWKNHDDMLEFLNTDDNWVIEL